MPPATKEPHPAVSCTNDLHPVGSAFEYRREVPGSVEMNDDARELNAVSSVSTTHLEHRHNRQEPRQRPVNESAWIDFAISVG